MKAIKTLTELDKVVEFYVQAEARAGFAKGGIAFRAEDKREVVRRLEEIGFSAWDLARRLEDKGIVPAKERHRHGARINLFFHQVKRERNSGAAVVQIASVPAQASPVASNKTTTSHGVVSALEGRRSQLETKIHQKEDELQSLYLALQELNADIATMNEAARIVKAHFKA